MGLEDLFDELERESRERGRSLMALGKLPHGKGIHQSWGMPNRTWDDMWPLTRREERELRRLKTAWAAATDVDTMIALVRGEKVDRRRLNTDVVREHRRRTRG